MVFILIERQIFVVSVPFYLTKIHWVVPEIFFFFFVTSPVNTFKFYFPGDFSGV